MEWLQVFAEVFGFLDSEVLRAAELQRRISIQLGHARESSERDREVRVVIRADRSRLDAQHEDDGKRKGSSGELTRAEHEVPRLAAARNGKIGDYSVGASSG